MAEQPPHRSFRNWILTSSAGVTVALIMWIFMEFLGAIKHTEGYAMENRERIIALEVRQANPP